MVIAYGIKKGYSKAKLSKGEGNIADRSSTILWYKCFGHVSEKEIQILVSKQILPEVRGTYLKKYVQCISGEHHKVTFWSTPLLGRKNILDLIHIDICFIYEKSMGGAHYFVMFIDDYSRKK